MKPSDYIDKDLDKDLQHSMLLSIIDEMAEDIHQLKQCVTMLTLRGVAGRENLNVFKKREWEE